MRRYIWPIASVLVGTALLAALEFWGSQPDFGLAAGIVPWVLPLATVVLALAIALLAGGCLWGVGLIIFKAGKRPLIAPKGSAWNGFFQAPGVDLGERDQPAGYDREGL